MVYALRALPQIGPLVADNQQLHKVFQLLYRLSESGATICRLHQGF